MATITLNSLNRENKEVTLKTFTRKMQREINEEMMKGVIVKSSSFSNDTEIPVLNTERASELAVKLVSGLTQTEIDELDAKEYEVLKELVDKETNPLNTEKKIEK